MPFNSYLSRLFSCSFSSACFYFISMLSKEDWCLLRLLYARVYVLNLLMLLYLTSLPLFNLISSSMIYILFLASYLLISSMVIVFSFYINFFLLCKLTILLCSLTSTWPVKSSTILKFHIILLSSLFSSSNTSRCGTFLFRYFNSPFTDF